MRKFGKILLIAALAIYDLAGLLQASDEATLQGAKEVSCLLVYTSMTVDQGQKLNDACRL